MEDALAYLLELRLRCRGDPDARAIVDRCLALLARAESCDGGELQRIEAEIQTLRTELAGKFSPPGSTARH